MCVCVCVFLFFEGRNEDCVLFPVLNFGDWFVFPRARVGSYEDNTTPEEERERKERERDLRSITL